MELFENGGLRDEGGMVDEVSGNDVPVGSTRKEVRDDIPAMLSEGEFVFPADVVRYIGLENLMRMRQDAKQGLKQMEAMGQMGNGDEATLPDDMPFGMMDLIIVEGKEEEKDKPKEMAQGGVIKAQEGTFVIPKFDPRNQDVRDYTNEAGEIRKIPFLNGKPLYPIPVGFYPVGTDIPTEDEAAEVAPVDRGDDDPSPKPEPTEFQKAGGWDMDFGDPPDPKKVDLWIAEAKKTTGNTPMIATGVASLFGGIPAAFVHAANKLNAKGRDANLQRAIEAAKKTPTAGQVAALNQIATDIEEGADETILDKLGGAVKELFGVSDEDATKVQKVAINSGAATKPILRPKLRPAPTDGTSTDVSPTDTAPVDEPPTDTEPKTEAQQMIEAGFTGREDAPFVTPTETAETKPVEPDNTLQQNLTELGLEDVDIGSDPEEANFGSNARMNQGVSVPSGDDTTTPDMPTEDTSPAAISPLETPNTLPLRTQLAKDKALERLKQVDVDQYNKLVQDLEEGTKPLEVGLAEISPEASKTLADFEPKGLGLGLANESPETVKTVAEQFAELMAPVRGETTDDDDGGGPAFPSIAPVTTEPPTVSDIESYLAKVAQEEAAAQPSQQDNNDDDDPFAPVATQEQISQAQEQATQSAIESGATQEEAEQAGTVAGGQMAGKGYVGGYGFKKGGLASRKKK